MKGGFRDIGWMKQGWAEFAGVDDTLRRQRMARFLRDRTRPARVAAQPQRPTYKNEPPVWRPKHKGHRRPKNDITRVGELFRP